MKVFLKRFLPHPSWIIPVILGWLLGGLTIEYRNWRKEKNEKIKIVRVLQADIVSILEKIKPFQKIGKEKTWVPLKNGSWKMVRPLEEPYDFSVYEVYVGSLGILKANTVEKTLQFYQLLRLAEETRKLCNQESGVPTDYVPNIFKEYLLDLRKAFLVGHQVIILLENEI